MQVNQKDELTIAAVPQEQPVEESLFKGLDSDDAQLALMGKRPELRRVYGFWTRTLTGLLVTAIHIVLTTAIVCAYQVMITCSWSCLVVLYSTIFDIGGPEALVIGT